MLLFLAQLFLFNTLFSNASVIDPEQSVVQENHDPKLQESFGSRSIGHLVSSNNVVLAKGEYAVGTMYTAYGISNKLSVGFSPFVARSFEMVNLLVRWAQPISSKERIGFDFAYFKSFGKESSYDRAVRLSDQEFNIKGRERYSNGFTSFKMEAVSINSTYNIHAQSFYRFNISTSGFYYFDDEKPFSLRMDPYNGDKYAFNITTLHEIKLSPRHFINIEYGFWGLNYFYPYQHFGSTFNYQYKAFFLGIGASTTFTNGFSEDNAKTYVFYDSRRSIHPEFQLTFFF